MVSSFGSNGSLDGPYYKGLRWEKGPAKETWFQQFDRNRKRKQMNLEDLPAEEEPESSAVAGQSEFGPDGFDRNGEFQGQEALVRFFVAESIPQLFVESIHFQDFIDLVNPLRPMVSSLSLRKTAFRLFAKYRGSLLPILKNFKGRISLTSSVWFDHDGYEDLNGLIYMYLNCHWIDEQWEKQSRVLGFVQLDWPIDDSPENVSFVIRRIVSRWGIGEKILSINFDGMSNVPASVSKLKRSLNPILDGQLFHSKCAYHIVNSCLEQGFSAISGLVDKVRSVVDFFYVDESRGQQLKEMCVSSGMNKFRRLYFDLSDWNNTVYDMVDGFIRIRDILVEFNKLEPDASNCHGVPLTLLTEDEWIVLSAMRNFFEKFRSAFDTLCSVYVPTTNLVVPIVVTLSEAFNQYRDNSHVGQICSAMEAKFAAYWGDDDGIGIPMVYCLATILDPRYKLDGLFKLLDAYNANMKIQARDRKPEIKNLFYRMYDAYSKQHTLVVPEDLVRTGISTGTKTALAIARSDDSEVSSCYSEIDYYLSSSKDLQWSESEMEKMEMLDVLKWWKGYECRYPVLGSMARDLLAMASAKVPEDVFDFHSPEVNERRREMGPRTADMCVCFKDWLRAEHRMQHLFVNKEGDPCSSDDEKDHDGEGQGGDEDADEDDGGDEDDDDADEDGGGDENGDEDYDEDEVNSWYQG